MAACRENHILRVHKPAVSSSTHSGPTNPGARIGVRSRIGVICLSALLALGAKNAPAQQTGVCSETPGTGESIGCTEDAASSNQIKLTLKGVDIDTTGDDVHGVYGHHEGSARIFIDLQTGLDEEAGGLIRNDIHTMGERAHGVRGRHAGSGNIEIGGQNLHITTVGDGSHGVTAYLGYRPAVPESPDLPPEAAGNINIVVWGSTIETAGSGSLGIYAENYGGEGRIDIRVENSTITSMSEGFGSRGIYGVRRGTTTGDANVTVDDVNITTKSRSGIGIDIDHAGEDTANITIDVERGRIDTAGYNGYAIRGFRSLGTGNIDIDVIGTVINTMGTHGRGIDAYMYQNNGDIDVYAENMNVTSTGEQGHGMRTRFQVPADGEQAGDILVDVRGGSITTKGVFAYGLYNRHEGTGLLDIDIRNLDIKTESTDIYREVGTPGEAVRARYFFTTPKDR